jgi:hypothetical protein
VPDRYFYPEILSSDDLKLLHETVRDLLKAERGGVSQRDPEAVAKIVLRLYRTGLTDRAKLMSLATLMAEQATARNETV